MGKIIFDVLEIALIILLLVSSYIGFFFAGFLVLYFAGVEVTKLILLFVFAISVATTHMILRWLTNVQGTA